MKKTFFVSMISLLLITEMSLSFAECLSLGPIQNVRSGDLIADAKQAFKVGDSVIINEDGSATVMPARGKDVRVITADELEVVKDPVTGEIIPQDDGNDLLRQTKADLEKLTSKKVKSCLFERSGFHCIVFDYYCACYYGIDDGGLSCNCGSINNTNVCDRRE